MRRQQLRRQCGVALIALLAVLAIGASAYLIRQLNVESGAMAAVRINRNAEVLNRAKLALIGYVAAQTAKAFEDNPGALPCPEHPWYVDQPTKVGGAGPSVGVSNPGYGSANCSSIGRYPWRTIGTDKLVDSNGEPLWYVVGPAWRKTSTSTNTVINSNSTGDLTVDGQQVVALIIAPGPAINATAGTTPTGAACAARNQIRSAPAGTMNPLDYLECYNAATLQFSAVGTSNSFNDQVVKITAAEILPAIEAAIANRIEREIVPTLKSVYAASTWATNLSPTNPLFPYPATFGNPTTASYRGAAGQGAGLLPFFQTQGCTPATDPRCTTATTGGSAFLVFSKSGADSYTPLIDLLNLLNLGWIRTQSTCSWSSQTYICTGQYQAFPIAVTLRLRVSNVAMGLRTFDASRITCTAVDDAGGGIPSQNIGCASTSVALQPDGSAIVTVTTNWTPSIVLSGWGTYANYVISFDRAVFGDHVLLDSTDATTGWFVRNEWYRLLYYAVAGGHTAAALPGTPGCTDGSTCLVARNPAGNLTTLNGGISGTDTTLVVASSSGAPATSFRMQVDAEVMRVTAVAGTTWTVVRGTEGSIATSHDDQSRVKLVGRDRALLILAGRSINGSPRPSASATPENDYLEFGNATAAYERQTITAVIPSSYVDTGGANAYSLASASPVSGRAFQFKALTTNTLPPTLSTPATGVRSLVNSDGTPLAASAIQANAAVQVNYDGTQFLLTKRPFNDRIVVIDANP